MPNWGAVLNQISNEKNPLDKIRHKYLKTLFKYTDRNVIAYYSGFLQKGGIDHLSIDDSDKNAFMQAVNGLDKTKGLDLILHTPGGDIAATESIVHYLKQMFGNDIRAIIPQIAMSAGTMISLSCKTIIMGKQSNIGPIDPQFGGMSCAGVLEEFEKAYADITQFPGKIVLWQPIISKYHPTFLGDCQKAIDWSNTMVCEWLKSNMLYDTPELAESIVSALSSHDATKNHARHIHIEECESLGIKIEHLENLKKEEIDECADFQDCVLTIHHAYMHTFSKSNAIKIVENQNGNAMISQMQ